MHYVLSNNVQRLHIYYLFVRRTTYKDDAMTFISLHFSSIVWILKLVCVTGKGIFLCLVVTVIAAFCILSPYYTSLHPASFLDNLKIGHLIRMSSSQLCFDLSQEDILGFVQKAVNYSSANDHDAVVMLLTSMGESCMFSLFHFQSVTCRYRQKRKKKSSILIVRNTAF